MSTKSKTKKKEPVYDIETLTVREPEPDKAKIDVQTDPWDEYRTLEASRNQSDILLAILHELVKLREANHAKG